MIRMTLRQFRLQLVIAAGALTVVAIILGVTGPDLAHVYDTTVGTCARDGGYCSTALVTFNDHDRLLRVVVQALPIVLPVLLGMFWGAPLVAGELESGTFRLAWTQSRSRLQWLAAKLAVVGLTTVAVQGLLSLMTTWWWMPVGRANPDRFSPAIFGAFGIAPIGYAVFALALGVTAGILLRRTVPAMATTLAAFVGVRLAVTFLVRPGFASEVHQVVALDPNGTAGIDSGPGIPLHLVFGNPQLPNAWVRSIDTVNASGQHPTGPVLAQLCPTLVKAVSDSRQTDMHSAFTACVTRVAASFHHAVVYQPASRYWPFQWAELALFVGLAVGMVALSAWWIRRRLI